MNAEIIAIGSELTSGARLDTNSQWLSLQLAELGITVGAHATAADDLGQIVETVRAAAGRSSVVLITGGLGPTRLGTDTVDVYYAHAPDDSTPIDETLRAMDDMVRSGRVHYIACSNYRAWRLTEALWTSDRLGLDRFQCVQPLYNLVNRDIEVELLPACREYGIGVVSYSPLARGILTGKYRPGQPFPEGSRAARHDKRLLQAELREASLEISQKLSEHCDRKGCTPSQFALAWVLNNPILTSVIIGPRTMEQYADNLRCLELSLSGEDEAFVDSLVPPGEHSGKGFQDELYPITGRGR